MNRSKWMNLQIWNVWNGFALVSFVCSKSTFWAGLLKTSARYGYNEMIYWDLQVCWAGLTAVNGYGRAALNLIMVNIRERRTFQQKMEAIADDRHYIWHSFFWIAGCKTDLTALGASPLMGLTVRAEYSPRCRCSVLGTIWKKAILDGRQNTSEELLLFTFCTESE